MEAGFKFKSVQTHSAKDNDCFLVLLMEHQFFVPFYGSQPSFSDVERLDIKTPTPQFFSNDNET